MNLIFAGNNRTTPRHPQSFYQQKQKRSQVHGEPIERVEEIERT